MKRYGINEPAPALGAIPYDEKGQRGYEKTVTENSYFVVIEEVSQRKVGQVVYEKRIFKILDRSGKMIEATPGRGQALLRARDLEARRRDADATKGNPLPSQPQDSHQPKPFELYKDNPELQEKMKRVEAGFDEIRQYQEDVAKRHAELDRKQTLEKLREQQREVQALINKLDTEPQK